MAKKSSKDDPVNGARRKLARAQLKLNAAQDEHAQERVRGQQEIERARLKAAKWLAKAAQRVERRTEQVAAAESRLHSSLAGETSSELLSAMAEQPSNGAGSVPATPEAAAALLQEHAADTSVPDVSRIAKPKRTRTRRSPAESDPSTEPL